MSITLPSGLIVSAAAPQPTTWIDQAGSTPGLTVTANALEDISGGVAAALNRPLFQGVAASAASVPSSTWTPLAVAETIDTEGGHSDAANPNKWIAPVTPNEIDWYLVSGFVPFSATSSAASHIAGLRVNSTNVYEGAKLPGGTGHALDLHVVDLLPFAPLDWVELMAWQGTGAAVNTSVSGKAASLTIRWACSPEAGVGAGSVVAAPGTPRTWTANDLITASATGTVGGLTRVPLNTHVRDVLHWLRFPPAARITSEGTTQTIPSGAWTSIQMPGEWIDTYNGHSTSTNNTRYTAQRAGLYYIYGLTAHVEPSSSTGYRASRLLVNGTTPIYGSSTIPATTSTAGTALPVSAHVRLNVGDYIELQAWQNQGSALAVKSGTGDHARLIALWRRN